VQEVWRVGDETPRRVMDDDFTATILTVVAFALFVLLGVLPWALGCYALLTHLSLVWK
jgi:hypothetical protein